MTAETKVCPCGLTVAEWALERLDNCYRIAAEKSGSDLESWLEDAWYWGEIVKMVSNYDHVRTALQELFDLQTISMAPGDWTKEFKVVMRRCREALSLSSEKALTRD